MRLSRKVLQSPSATVIKTLSEKQSISIGSSNSHASSTDLWHQADCRLPSDFATTSDLNWAEFAPKQIRSIWSCHRWSQSCTWQSFTLLPWLSTGWKHGRELKLILYSDSPSADIKERAQTRNNTSIIKTGSGSFSESLNVLYMYKYSFSWFSEIPLQLVLTVRWISFGSHRHPAIFTQCKPWKMTKGRLFTCVIILSLWWYKAWCRLPGSRCGQRRLV